MGTWQLVFESKITRRSHNVIRLDPSSGQTMECFNSNWPYLRGGCGVCCFCKYITQVDLIHFWCALFGSSCGERSMQMTLIQIRATHRRHSKVQSLNGNVDRFVCRSAHDSLLFKCLISNATHVECKKLWMQVSSDAHCSFDSSRAYACACAYIGMSVYYWHGENTMSTNMMIR